MLARDIPEVSIVPNCVRSKRDANGTAAGEDTNERRGILSVAGLPLLDEDIDVIVNVR